MTCPFNPPSDIDVELRRAHLATQQQPWNNKSFWHHLVGLDQTEMTDLEKWAAIRHLIENHAPTDFQNYVRMRTKTDDSIFILRYHLAPIEDVRMHLININKWACYHEWVAYCKRIGYYQEPADKAAILQALTIKPESTERLAERRQRSEAIQQLQQASDFGRHQPVMWKAIEEIFRSSWNEVWSTIMDRIAPLLEANENFSLVNYLDDTQNLDDIRLALHSGYPAEPMYCKQLIRRLPTEEQELWADYGERWEYEEASDYEPSDCDAKDTEDSASNYHDSDNSDDEEMMSDGPTVSPEPLYEGWRAAERAKIWQRK